MVKYFGWEKDLEYGFWVRVGDLYRHNGVGFWAQQLGCDRPVAGGRWTQ